MISRAELSKLQEIGLADCNPSELVDLKHVSVDKGYPIVTRMESFVNDVANPYLFRVDDVAVKVEFTGTKSFAQVLPRCFVIG